MGKLDLIERWIEITNHTGAPVELPLFRCGNVQLPSHDNYRLTHYSGNWGAEYQPQRHMLHQEQVVLESHRGTCSAHQHTPFVTLDPDGEATDTQGDVFFAALEWSGENRMIVEKNAFGDVQLCAGWNDYDAEWTLRDGETLSSPKLAAGYSGAGFNRMTEILYDLQFDELCPQSKVHNVLPIIYNSWYPYEFDVREDNMLSLIDKAADIGAELFVIDDGWMPGRTDDKKGLGDWRPDPASAQRPASHRRRRATKRGCCSGLWVEPDTCKPRQRSLPRASRLGSSAASTARTRSCAIS